VTLDGLPAERVAPDTPTPRLRVKSDATGIDVDLGTMCPPDEQASVVVLTVK